MIKGVLTLPGYYTGEVTVAASEGLPCVLTAQAIPGQNCALVKLLLLLAAL